MIEQFVQFHRKTMGKFASCPVMHGDVGQGASIHTGKEVAPCIRRGKFIDSF